MLERVTSQNIAFFLSVARKSIKECSRQTVQDINHLLHSSTSTSVSYLHYFPYSNTPPSNIMAPKVALKATTIMNRLGETAVLSAFLSDKHFITILPGGELIRHTAVIT